MTSKVRFVSLLLIFLSLPYFPLLLEVSQLIVLVGSQTLSILSPVVLATTTTATVNEIRTHTFRNVVNTRLTNTQRRVDEIL